MRFFLVSALVLIVLFIGVVMLTSFSGQKNRRKNRWAFAEKRENISSESWLDQFAGHLSARERVAIVNLLKGITESTGVSWTRLRPNDLIGPHLFENSIFQIEDSWALFSDFVLATEPDLYEKIEMNWLQNENGFNLGQVISSIGGEKMRDAAD